MTTSPLRPRDQRQESGIAARGQLTHPRNALRRFTFVRHHDASRSRAPFRHALTGAGRQAGRDQPPSGHPVNPGPRPCLRCWIPPNGLQVRTHTSDLNVRARHTPARSTNSLRSSPGNPGAIPNPRAPSSAACCSSSVLVPLFCVLLLVVVGIAISFARAYAVPRTIPVRPEVSSPNAVPTAARRPGLPLALERVGRRRPVARRAACSRGREPRRAAWKACGSAAVGPIAAVLVPWWACVLPQVGQRVVWGFAGFELYSCSSRSTRSLLQIPARVAIKSLLDVTIPPGPTATSCPSGWRSRSGRPRAAGAADSNAAAPAGVLLLAL